MKFGPALNLMEAGHRVARAGWNGKGMFIYLVPAASYPAQRGAAKRWLGEGAMVPYGAYLAMKTAQDNVVPWLAIQTDILAQDWVSIEDEVVACTAGYDCTNPGCTGVHPNTLEQALARAADAADLPIGDPSSKLMEHRFTVPAAAACPAGPLCTSLKCRLDHSAGAGREDRHAILGPDDCPFGSSCGRVDCSYTHPA